MKKSFLLLPLMAAGAYFTLSSNSTGYPANRTGSDGVSSTTGCGGGGCHGSSASTSMQFLPTGAIVLDSAGTGTMVTRWTAGKTYIVHFGAMNTSLTDNLPKFGFQLSSVSGSGSSSVQAGNFGTAPAGTSVLTFGGRQVFTHTTPRACTAGSGGAGSIDSVSIAWTAPAAGTGTVTFYAVINGVNSDGGATAADKWNNASASFTELVDHTSVGSVNSGIAIKATPNPVISSLNLEMTNAAAGNYGVKVYDMSGKVVATQNVEVAGNSTNANINMSTIAAGMYQVVVEKDGVRSVTPIVKQ